MSDDPDRVRAYFHTGGTTAAPRDADSSDVRVEVRDTEARPVVTLGVPHGTGAGTAERPALV